MNYCLDGQVSFEYIKKENVTEIKFPYRARNAIPGAYEKFPDKTFILQNTSVDNFIDWDEIEVLQSLTMHQLILCLSSIDDCKIAKARNIPFYYGYPIKTFYELKAFIDLGVCYVRLGAPLFFSRDKVHSLGVKVRAVPNVAYNDGLPRERSWDGTWIRPEDIQYYEGYVDVIEFEDCPTAQKEETLYRVYAEDKQWGGRLNLLITNMAEDEEEVRGLLFPDDFALGRLNCEHKCQTRFCSYCKTAYLLASKYDDIVKKKKELEE